MKMLSYSWCAHVLVAILLLNSMDFVRSDPSCNARDALNQKYRSVRSHAATAKESLESLTMELDVLERVARSLKEPKDCPEPVAPPREGNSFPRDCSGYVEKGHKESGVYKIAPKYLKHSPINVYCDMESDGGGWTVLGRRGDFGEPPLDFDERVFEDYHSGFGNLDGEFYLGNEYLFALTNEQKMVFQVDVMNNNNRTSWTSEILVMVTALHPQSTVVRETVEQSNPPYSAEKVYSDVHIDWSNLKFVMTNYYIPIPESLVHVRIRPLSFNADQ